MCQTHKYKYTNTAYDKVLERPNRVSQGGCPREGRVSQGGRVSQRGVPEGVPGRVSHGGEGVSAPREGVHGRVSKGGCPREGIPWRVSHGGCPREGVPWRVSQEGFTQYKLSFAQLYRV